MKKIIFAAIIALLLGLSSANAITQQEISEAKGLIDSKVDCKELSDSQLEIMGEYYMEQMHPGESHELMHKMMGLQEGSEDEKQFHINMARGLEILWVLEFLEYSLCYTTDWINNFGLSLDYKIMERFLW